MPKVLKTENKEIYSDFDINFTNNPLTDDITQKTDTHSINQSLKNLVQTNHYERPFYPQIGCNINAILFEPMDDITKRDLEDALKYTFTNFEPRVKILEVLAIPSPADNAYKISVTYKIRATEYKSKFDTVLKRLR